MIIQDQTSLKYTFSGHETFQCRHLWLKKGFDFVKSKKSFNDVDAVVVLGVGKNMVSSIRFWMKAFNLLTLEDELTVFANKVFADDGYDPYLEDEGTLWLLHYQLVKKGFASTYSIIFNELRKEKIEFTKENFISYIVRKAETEKLLSANRNTLQEDFTVFTKMYLRFGIQSKDKEDGFLGIFTELNLVKSYSKSSVDFYIIENTDKPEIPEEIILYAILDSEDFDLSVNLNAIEQNINSIVSIFAINKPGLTNKIESISKKNPDMIYSDHAGVKELQFKKKPTAYSLLDLYYAK